MPPVCYLSLILLCALGWPMSSAFTPLPPHPSDILHQDNSYPLLTYAWPPPPWLATSTLPPGQEAMGHQPLLDVNGPITSTPHPYAPPPDLQPATTADMPSLPGVALPSCLQPKPHPIFGHTPTDDKDSLPDTTLATILVDIKPTAMVASMAVSGKWAGCGMKAIKSGGWVKGR